MKAEIWCASNALKNISGVLVWRGEIPFVPTKDTYLVIYDGWGGAVIERVFYSVDTCMLNIEISPDFTGEYEKESRKRGFIK